MLNHRVTVARFSEVQCYPVLSESVIVCLSCFCPFHRYKGDFFNANLLLQVTFASMVLIGIVTPGDYSELYLLTKPSQAQVNL